MVYIDQTSTFREILFSQNSSNENAEASGSSSRVSSPVQRGRGSSSVGSKGKKKKLDEKELERKKKDEEFLKEAYRINNHLQTLSSLLRTIRRPYLSLEAPPLHSHSQRYNRSSKSNQENDDEDEMGLNGLENAKYLSDRERDEVDLRSKVILKSCRERVGLLEILEKARQSSQPSPTSTTTTLITSLLPSLSPQPPPATSLPAVLTAHRASILFYLNTSIMELTTKQHDLQEERVKRREQRSRNLGSAMRVSGGESLGGKGGNEKALGWFGGGTGKGKGKEMELKGINLTIPTTSFNNSSSSGASGGGVESEFDNDPDSSSPNQTLTPQQIQQFSQENNQLLDQMSQSLAVVQKAESSLLEISHLQSSLISHLQSQSEIIDKLFDDAVGSVGDVERANKELKKARERGKEGRVFLLVFLLGATVALLFLDWYSD